MKTSDGSSKAPRLAGHPYPMSIGLDTHERLQASISHLSLLDFATDDYLRQPDPIGKFHRYMTSKGVDEGTWETSWDCMGKHSAVLRSWVLQQAVIALRSQWDWYVSRLGEFLRFARGHVAGPCMSSKMEGNLTRLGWTSIGTQLECIEEGVGGALKLPQSQRDLVAEMSLVRNLVLHNRGEVDEHYLRHTRESQWQVGEIRGVDWPEAELWHAALIQAVSSTDVPVAEVYAEAPAYTGLGGA